jgi:hypothetical protein
MEATPTITRLWGLFEGVVRRDEGAAQPATEAVARDLIQPSIALGTRHPLASAAGSLGSAPWWDDFIAAKHQYRREVDADDSVE